MPIFHTTRFGPIDYDEASVIHFPAGLPAFESERQFIALRDPATEPLLFLQSLTTASPSQASVVNMHTAFSSLL